MPNWSQGDVTANGIRQHCYRTGAGDKPPLILAHGFTDNGLCWTPVAEALEDEYDIIMVDSRGHGLSDAPEEDYAITTLAEDLASLVMALGLQQPAMLGHSMGAATIAFAAANHPNLARCILLEDPPLWANFVLLPLEEQQARVETARAQTREGARKTREEHIARSREEFPTWPEAERGPWAQAKQQLSPNVFQVTTHYIPWQDTIRQITCPILLITGDPERGGIVTPATADEAASLWRAGRVAHIPKTGHSIRRDAFGAYLQVVREFLKATEA